MWLLWHPDKRFVFLRIKRTHQTFLMDSLGQDIIAKAASWWKVATSSSTSANVISFRNGLRAKTAGDFLITEGGWFSSGFPHIRKIPMTSLTLWNSAWSGERKKKLLSSFTSKYYWHKNALASCHVKVTSFYCPICLFSVSMWICTKSRQNL